MINENIFSQLSDIILNVANSQDIVENEDDCLNIFTRHIMKNKKPLYFGGVKIGKSYVSYHLMPVYVFPELLSDISPELKKRMQGKSCFNFKKVDSQLFRELDKLTQLGFKKYKSAGYIV